MAPTANFELLVRLVALCSVLATGLNLTVWAVVDKYNGWEWYDTYHPRWAPARTCMLCVAFWLTMAYMVPAAITAAIALSNPWLLVLAIVPFLVAAITLKLATSK